MADDPSFWRGDCFITGGHVWALADNDDTLDTVCLGRAEVILPVMKGGATIPDEVTGQARRILLEIIEEGTIGQTESTVSRPSIRRGRSCQPTTRQQGHTGRIATAEAATSRPAEQDQASLSGILDPEVVGIVGSHVNAPQNGPLRGRGMGLGGLKTGYLFGSGITRRSGLEVK